MFPRIHPFTLDKWSSRGDVHSRHEPSNFASSASSRVTEHCPRAAVFMKPASEHNLINLVSSGRFSHFRSYSRSKSPCTVFIGQKLFGRCRQLCGCWKHGLWFVLSYKTPCTFWTVRFCRDQLITHIRYCSVDIELIDGTNFVFVWPPKCIFPHLLLHKYPRSKALDPRNTGCELSLKLIIMSSATWSHSPFD